MPDVGERKKEKKEQTLQGGGGMCARTSNTRFSICDKSNFDGGVRRRALELRARERPSLLNTPRLIYWRGYAATASLKASWKSSKILKKVKISEKGENMAKLAHLDLHENRPATQGGSRMASRHLALCSPREPRWTCEPLGGPESSFLQSENCYCVETVGCALRTSKDVWLRGYLINKL